VALLIGLKINYSVAQIDSLVCGRQSVQARLTKNKLLEYWNDGREGIGVK
jgi:hypothetical protein